MNKIRLTTVYDNSHDEYPALLEAIKSQFSRLVGSGVPLFNTDAENLSEIFLNSLPVEAYQHYNCRNCRNFLDQYGGLVTLSDKGVMTPVISGKYQVPPFFQPALKAMNEVVMKSKVSGVFLSEKATLGNPVTGEWKHFSVTLPNSMVYRREDDLTAEQKMAEKLEDRKVLTHSLRDFSQNVIDKAMALINSDAMYRTDKVLPVAQWFQALQSRYSSTWDSNAERNIVWHAVATNSAAFTHVRSTMIGTLLSDIAEGYPMSTVQARFKHKMLPENHMRSKAAPTEGAKAEAEKLVEKKGIRNSFLRRYATLDDIPEFLWREKPKFTADSKLSGGLFDSVVTKGRVEPSPSQTELPSTTMTWSKFCRTMLTSASSIEALVDNATRHMALVTASDSIAPNIVKWDNPITWYYPAGVDGTFQERVEGAGGQFTGNDIRCSLIWEGYTDLDLHCLTPSREAIHFNSKRDSYGGFLDIDMNGGAHRNSSPVENIRWGKGKAQEGRHVFSLHNYRDRSGSRKPETPFKVQLEVNGHLYVREGVAGDTNYTEVLFDFVYRHGEAPVFNSNAPQSVSASEGSWDVPVNSFAKVTAITNSPNMWGKEPVPQTGHHVFFLLDGCKDRTKGTGRGFLVEMLRSDLYPARKTLEAFMKDLVIDGIDEASACGVGYSRDTDWNLTLRVTTNGMTQLVKIDRFD